jgi:tRNA pseudouridine38-40 synthase
VPTFRITVAYDGTGFVGWQRQASGTSIQSLLEDALCELDGRQVVVSGAGRTDAGVHALGQVASFSLERLIEPAILVRAINGRLPETVRALDAQEVPSTFHARFAAISKTYRYRIWAAEIMSPFERAYAWHVSHPKLDVEAMALAAQHCHGRHDFAAFQAAGTPTRSSVREVMSSRLIATASGSPSSETKVSRDLHALIVYEVTADGFLRHMVRAIVGSLVEVGRGRRPPEWIGELIASQNRALAGPTAPPYGLFLTAVRYASSQGNARPAASSASSEAG